MTTRHAQFGNHLVTARLLPSGVWDVQNVRTRSSNFHQWRPVRTDREFNMVMDSPEVAFFDWSTVPVASLESFQPQA